MVPYQIYRIHCTSNQKTDHTRGKGKWLTRVKVGSSCCLWADAISNKTFLMGPIKFTTTHHRTTGHRTNRLNVSLWRLLPSRTDLTVTFDLLIWNFRRECQRTIFIDPTSSESILDMFFFFFKLRELMLFWIGIGIGEMWVSYRDVWWSLWDK